MAAAQKVRSVYEVLGNATAMDKTCLISINNGGDGSTKPVRHDFGEELHRAILERDRSERVSSADSSFLWYEHQVCPIQTI